jgi:pyruvate/2-oxoglutarate dehydrogenase complex dihydrolipoamide acyltransferase (E2) component
MKSTIKLPKVADTADNVVVSEIMVTPGQSVAAGDVLMSVETDKALVEVPSPIGGVVVDILVAIDDEIVTGTPFIVVESA